MVDSFHRIISVAFIKHWVTKHSSVSKFIARFIIILHPPSYVLWIFQLPFLSAPALLLLPGTLLTTATQIFSVAIGFQKAFILLKTKLSVEGTNYTVNENGIPCCPHDPSLPMRREGSKSHLWSKLPTMKFVCPKMKWEYDPAAKSKRRVCHCDNPCTSSFCGRMIYIYPERNLRAYPGVERGSQEWEDTYKIRVNVEKSINHFKDSFCIADRKTQNEKTLHADLLLAGITQLVTVLVADKIHQYQYIRSLKPLIA